MAQIKIVIAFFLLLMIPCSAALAQDSAPIKVTINCDSAPPAYGRDFKVTYAYRQSDKPTQLVQLVKDDQAAAWVKTATLPPSNSSDTAWTITPSDDATLFGLYRLMIQDRFLCDNHPAEPETETRHQIEGVQEKVVVRTSGFTHTMVMEGQIPNWAWNVIERIRAIAKM